MSQLQKKFLASNAVDDTKIRLSNNTYLRSRNAANSGDVNTLKVNASDKIEFASVPQVTSDASAGNDLVRYSQVQALLQGLKPKQAVFAATTGSNITLSGGAPDTLDGQALSANNRILVKDQTDPKENGIYYVSTLGTGSDGTWTRATDADASSEFPGSYTLVEFGTVNAGFGYVCTVLDSFVLGTDNVTFVKFSSTPTTYTGGDMITVTGTVITVDLATTSGLESTNPGNAAGQLRIKTDTTTANTIGTTITTNGAGTKFDANSFTDSGSETLALASGVAGDGLSLTTGVLSVNTDNSTIEINTDTLRVKDAGITLAKMASDSVDENKIVSTTFSTTGALDGGSGTKVSVRVDGTTIKKNGSNNLEGLKGNEQHPTLSGTDITNQYYDLAFAAYGTSASVNSISLSVAGGIEQVKGVDYTVSLTGGSGGVTRITFAGDLATGGAAELVAGDILMIKYSYLT